MVADLLFCSGVESLMEVNLCLQTDTCVRTKRFSPVCLRLHVSVVCMKDKENVIAEKKVLQPLMYLHLRAATNESLYLAAESLREEFGSINC